MRSNSVGSTEDIDDLGSLAPGTVQATRRMEEIGRPREWAAIIVPEIHLLPQRTNAIDELCSARIQHLRTHRCGSSTMKFHLSNAAGNVFTGYGPGYVEINKQRFESSLLVSADQISSGWAPGGFASLTRDDYAKLLEWQPEIVLL